MRRKFQRQIDRNIEIKRNKDRDSRRNRGWVYGSKILEESGIEGKGEGIREEGLERERICKEINTM